MFESLKKMFAQGDGRQARPADASTDAANNTRQDFLCRETVFDRAGRPGAHLYRLRTAHLPGEVPQAGQRQFDQILLDTLGSNPEMKLASPCFLPILSDSLDLIAVDRLAGAKTALLIQLSEQAEAAPLATRLSALREKGLRIGLFRQPGHPAFAELLPLLDFAAIDVRHSEAGQIRDFAAAIRASSTPAQLVACNIDHADEYRLCLRWHYSHFHGQFAAHAPHRPLESGDPHKVFLLNLLRLVQGDADNAEIAEAMKQDPLLAFRILRYLNSPVMGLAQPIDSLNQALTIIGRQKLIRWLAVLLFSVREPDFGDWLLVESALTRGRLMEVLGQPLFSGKDHDALFLVGIFSCLDRLLHRPMPEALADVPVAPAVREALLERRGPYAALLAVAEASESFDPERIAGAAATAGLPADVVNQALIAATAWASEVTEHWE